MSDSHEDRVSRAKRLRPAIALRVREAPSERRAAEEIGVSNTALSKFLNGETPYDPTLDKYERWLEGRETSDTGRRRDFGAGLAGADLAELYVRIDRIEAADMPEWLRVLRMDALASAVRAEAMLQAERASLERASAIRDAEVAAGERARTAGIEAETASSRALAVAGGGSTARAARVAEKLTPEEIAVHGQLPPQAERVSEAVAGSGRGSGAAPRNAEVKR